MCDTDVIAGADADDVVAVADATIVALVRACLAKHPNANSIRLIADTATDDEDIIEISKPTLSALVHSSPATRKRKVSSVLLALQQREQQMLLDLVALQKEMIQATPHQHRRTELQQLEIAPVERKELEERKEQPVAQQQVTASASASASASEPASAKRRKTEEERLNELVVNLPLTIHKPIQNASVPPPNTSHISQPKKRTRPQPKTDRELYLRALKAFTAAMKLDLPEEDINNHDLFDQVKKAEDGEEIDLLIKAAQSHITDGKIMTMISYYLLSVLAHKAKNAKDKQYGERMAAAGVKDHNYQAALPRFYELINDRYNTDDYDELYTIDVFHSDLSWEDWMELVKPNKIHIFDAAYDKADDLAGRNDDEADVEEEDDDADDDEIAEG